MDIFTTGNIRDAHPLFKEPEFDDDMCQRTLMAFLQTWFYDGLLQAVIFKKIHRSYISRKTANGDYVVDSRNLPLALGAWHKTLSVDSQDVRMMKINHAIACCEWVLAMLERFSQPRDGDDGRFHISHFHILETEFKCIAPAIVLLAEAINAVVRDDVPLALYRVPPGCGIFTHRNQRLLQRGWCQSIISRYEVEFTPTVLSYVDALKVAQPNSNHKNCSPKKCSKDDVDIAAYEQQHFSTGCKCTKIKPDFKQVTDLIDRGKIPVLMLDAYNSPPKLNVLTYEERGRVEYAAISHCWADGLGSSTEEGIYLCQAMRISRLLKEYKRVEAFWIDSACIPKNRQYRRKAIASMRRVYQSASHVIVLSNDISEGRKGDNGYTLLWRIIASSWMRRLWTYQEAVLASSVLLEANGGLVGLDMEILTLRETAKASGRKGEREGFSDPMVFDMMVEMFNMRPKLMGSGESMDRSSKLLFVSGIMDQMRSRVTSNPKDEFLAISGALDIDIEKFIDLEGDAKVIKFFQLVRNVPWSIIFMKKTLEERVSSKPFRWLPRSLLGWSSNDVGVMDNDRESAGTCTQRGLEVYLYVLELDGYFESYQGRVEIQTESDNYYLFRRPKQTSIGKNRHADSILVYQNRIVQPLSKALQDRRPQPVRLLKRNSPDSAEVTCYFEHEFWIRMRGEMDASRGWPVMRARWVRRTIIVT